MKRNTWNITIFIFVLATFGVLSFFIESELLFDRDILQDLVKENYVLSIIVFISVAVLATLLFIPFTPISILAGYLFGTAVGILVAVAAISIGALIPFYLARYLGAPFVQELLKKRAPKLELYRKYIEQKSFAAVVLLRAVPILPKMVVNLGFGLSGINPYTYFVGTIVGMLPATVLLVYIGDIIVDIKNPMLYVILAIYVLYVALAMFLWRFFKRKNEQ